MLFISLIFVYFKHICVIVHELKSCSTHVLLFILDFHVLFKLMTILVFIYQVLLVCYTSFKIVHRENCNPNSWSWDIFVAFNMMLESKGSTQIISWATYETIYMCIIKTNWLDILKLENVRFIQSIEQIYWVSPRWKTLY